MDVTDRSRTAVSRHLSRLEREFGDVEHRRVNREYPSEEYEELIARFEEGRLGGAGTWVRNDEGEVLLVQETGHNAWSEPSGKHEGDERFAETARRETREETGVEVELTGVLRARITTARDEADPDRPAVVRLMVYFTAEPVEGTARPQPGETEAVDWFEELPDELLSETLRDFPL